VVQYLLLAIFSTSNSQYEPRTRAHANFDFCQDIHGRFLTKTATNVSQIGITFCQILISDG